MWHLPSASNNDIFGIRMIGYVTFGLWFIVCNIVQLCASPGPKCLFVVHTPWFYFFMKISTPYILCFPLIARLSLCHIAQPTHRLWSNLYDIRLLLVIVNFVISMIGYVTFGWWYTIQNYCRQHFRCRWRHRLYTTFPLLVYCTQYFR